MKWGIFMSGFIESKIIELKYHECDLKQELSLPMLLNLLVDVSTYQSEKLGVGIEYCTRNNKAWVLTGYDINIKQMPKFGGKFKFSTEAHSFNKFFCYRKFFVQDEEGNLLIDVMSTFMLIDITTRKLRKVEYSDISMYGVSENYKSTVKMKKPSKLKDIMVEKNYSVRYTDLDTNNHVNNSKYMEWVLDTVNIEFIKSHTPTDVAIKYEKEVVYGEDILSVCEIIEKEEEVITLHKIIASGNYACEIEIAWKKI